MNLWINQQKRKGAYRKTTPLHGFSLSYLFRLAGQDQGWRQDSRKEGEREGGGGGTGPIGAEGGLRTGILVFLLSKNKIHSRLNPETQTAWVTRSPQHRASFPSLFTTGFRLPVIGADEVVATFPAAETSFARVSA